MCLTQQRKRRHGERDIRVTLKKIPFSTWYMCFCDPSWNSIHKLLNGRGIEECDQVFTTMHAQSCLKVPSSVHKNREYSIRACNVSGIHISCSYQGVECFAPS